MTPEGRVKHKIRQMLDSIGAWYFMPMAGRFSIRGTPDFIGCFRGRMFSIEAKAKGGKTTKLQDICAAAIRAAGGLAFLIEGEDALEIAYVAHLLKQIVQPTDET